MDCQLLGKQGNTAFKDINKLETSRRFSRIIIFLLILFSFHSNAFSQRKSDIGLFGGTSYYMGDLNPSKHFYFPGYAFGPIYRYNFNPRSSIRFSGIYHNLSGNSAGYGDPYVESLNANFDATFIDASANYEINFIPYKTANRKLNQSLYLTAGVGYHVMLTSNVLVETIYSEGKSHFMIPFGIGYKFNITKKMSAGVELSVRKTFTDTGIDGLTNIDTETSNTLFGNKDWYTFAGIFISYKIFSYREDCPTYE